MAKKSIQTTPVSIRIKNDDLEIIDDYAEKLGVTRSHFVSQVVGIGLDQVGYLDKAGMLKFFGSMRSTVDWFRKEGKMPVGENEQS